MGSVLEQLGEALSLELLAMLAVEELLDGKTELELGSGEDEDGSGGGGSSMVVLSQEKSNTLQNIADKERKCSIFMKFAILTI